MGAHDYIVTYKTADQEKVRKLWKDTCTDDAYESGSGAYAGNATTMHGNITFYDKRVASLKEAQEFILDKHEKWTGPVACSYYLPAAETEKDKKRIAAAKEKLEAAKSKAVEASQEIADKFSARKSEFVGCTQCKSRLSMDQLRKRVRKGYKSEWSLNLAEVPKCPLCEASLLSATDLARLALHQGKVAEASKALEAASAPPPSKELAWAIGGWAAS